jgi:hypothetical protein
MCFLLDANINAQQTAAANQRLLFNSNNTPDLSTSSDNPFRSDCENPSKSISLPFPSFYFSFFR